jgi:serine/threonine protein kinase
MQGLYGEAVQFRSGILHRRSSFVNVQRSVNICNLRAIPFSAVSVPILFETSRKSLISGKGSSGVKFILPTTDELCVIEKAGRYQIIEEVGRGAMGVVYRGFDPTINRTVAIKTITLGNADPALLMRLRHEAQVAGVLSHPNVVTIYDAGEDQGFFYIAMEFVQGETLEFRLARGTVPFEEAVKIIDQVGAGLDHAHARKVIHRDIKPANIILSSDGTAKVMDFGVAKLTSLSVTTPGQILGTPSYFSPEVLKGLAIDRRSDIFSLGVVLFEMFCGSKPFKADNINTVMYKIVNEPPELTDQLKTQLAPGVLRVLQKTLEKDPQKRYQTCAFLVDDLKRSLTIKTNRVPVTPVAQAGDQTVMLDARAVRSQSPSPTPPAPPSPRPSPRNIPPAVPRSVPRPPPPEPKAVHSSKPQLILKVVLLLAVIGGAATWATRTLTAPVEEQAPAQAETKSAKDRASEIIHDRTLDVVAGTTDFIVSSNVRGALILVDGKSRPDWLTPKRIELEPGVHRIEVRKAGYKPQVQTVIFNDNLGSQPKYFKLEPAAQETATPATEAPSKPPEQKPQ